MNMKQSDFMREYGIKEGVVMKATARLGKYKEGTGKHVEYPEEELAREAMFVLKKRAEMYRADFEKTVREMNDLRLKYRDRKERGYI